MICRKTNKNIGRNCLGFNFLRGNNLESPGKLKRFNCESVSHLITGWVFACVHRVWALQTLTGVGSPWRHRRENGERTENKTTTLQ